MVRRLTIRRALRAGRKEQTRGEYFYGIAGDLFTRGISRRRFTLITPIPVERSPRTRRSTEIRLPAYRACTIYRIVHRCTVCYHALSSFSWFLHGRRELTRVCTRCFRNCFALFLPESEGSLEFPLEILSSARSFFLGSIADLYGKFCNNYWNS